MKFIAILFFAAVVLCATVNSSCNTGYKCIAEGESCEVMRSTHDDYNLYRCEPGTWCPLGLFDGNPAPNCTAYQSEGEYCDNDFFECHDGLSCYSNDGASSCQNLGYLFAGESCDAQIQCSDNLVCIEGKCSLEAGEACSSQSECPYGFYCNSDAEGFDYSICNATLPVGSNCTSKYNTALEEVCELGTVCSLDNKNAEDAMFTCVAIFSKKAGDSCSGDTSTGMDASIPKWDCNMAAGLYCENSICATPNYTPAASNCSDSANTCPAYQYQSCFCESMTSPTGACKLTVNLNAECQESIQDLTECAIDNECKFEGVDNNESRESCLYRNCRSIMCNNKCVAEIARDESCSEAPLYPACRSSSSFVKPSIAIALVFALVALFL
eukprot:gene433-515_t